MKRSILVVIGLNNYCCAVYNRTQKIFKRKYMKRNILIAIGFAIIITLFTAGCKKSSEGPTATDNSTSIAQSDKQSLDNEINSDPLLSAAGDQATLNDGAASNSASLAKADSSITPIAWGRTFTNWTGSKTYTKIDDSTIIATITNTLTGNLWIYTNNRSVIQKPIVVNTLRNVKFVKLTNTDSLSWVIRYITPVQGTTTSSSATISIEDVNFSIGTDTIDVTSPPYNDYLRIGGLNQMGIKGIHWLLQNPLRVLTVQATVVSSSPDSDVVVVHHPDLIQNRIIRERMRLISSTLNSDSTTYTRVYQRKWIGDYVGRHTVFVTAFTLNSIYDNSEPVTSEGWGVPYIVVK